MFRLALRTMFLADRGRFLVDLTDLLPSALDVGIEPGDFLVQFTKALGWSVAHHPQ